jgi:hypothetical protein
VFGRILDPGTSESRLSEMMEIGGHVVEGFLKGNVSGAVFEWVIV